MRATECGVGKRGANGHPRVAAQIHDLQNSKVNVCWGGGYDWDTLQERLPFLFHIYLGDAYLGCSCCGHIGHNSPKGRAGLGIRKWVCDACNTVHDRDVNAAKNILALGNERLAGGIIGPSGR